jgi:hypothetical protein
MGTRLPAQEHAALAAWIVRLESERVWTDTLRAERAKRACDASELVLVIALAEDFPKTAHRYHRVRDHVMVVGTVGEFLDTPLPVVNLDDLRIAEPRNHAHAVVLEGVHGVAIRFRLPDD